MDASPFVPIIIEATRFLFGEIRHWIDSVRQRAGLPSTGQPNRTGMTLTDDRFQALEKDPMALRQLINDQRADANGYLIEQLVEQLKIHRRNLVDHQTTEAEYGALTPAHIRRAIEREAKAIVLKTDRLKTLLEDVYGEGIDV